MVADPSNVSQQRMRELGDRHRKQAVKATFEINDLEEIKRFLVGKREFLLRLLENPNLLEHERFTELLWAVFHILEELEHRKDFNSLPETDLEHLRGDLARVYLSLLAEWLYYLGHLKDNYPYLFSLAMRTNPFNSDASPVVT